MAGPRKLNKGTRINGLPADGWNAFVDAWRRINQMPPRGNGPGISRGSPEQVQVMVKNSTGADLTERFPILRLTDPLVTPADITDAEQRVLRGVQLEGESPNANTKATFVVMQGPCRTDEIRPATLLGITWAKVDVQDASDGYATAVAADSAKLTSSTTGAEIVWKESGTGVKWAVIRLAPTADPGRIIRATVNGAVTSGDSVGNWDNAVAIVGPEPEASGTFDNSIYQQEYADNDIVFLNWNPDAEQWEPERGGSAGSIIIYFELTQDMAYADAAKLAKPVTAAGALDSGAAAFYVVDDQRQFYGKAAAGGDEGYRGFAWRYTDNYSGGVPGYRIITMEGPAYIIPGVLSADFSLGGTTFTPATDECWGLPFRNRRLPPSGDITVYDDFDVASDAKDGDKWYIIWNETQERYTFFQRIGRGYITIKGTSPGVTRATTTFTLGSPVAVNGELPTGTITVTNDPKLDSPSGRTIYARFNITRGSGTVQTAWDTGDAGNFVEMLRGLADYNALSGIPQLIDHDATGAADPHWHDTGDCS